MKKFDQLTRLLDFMEENIDSEHIRNIEQLQYDTIKYKEVDRLPLTIGSSLDGFEQVPYKEVFDNPEKMLYNELLWSSNHSPYNSVRIKDDGPLMIRSNHGAGVISSLFGCKLLIDDNKMPQVHKIKLDEAKKIFAKGVPNVKLGMGKKVIETYQYYHERLKYFSRCYSSLRITQPDMYGPYDILHMIIGDTALHLIHDNPKLAKYMIDIISDTYVSFRKEIDPLLTDKFEDAVFVNGYCCGGRVLLKANAATAKLSQEMYKLYGDEPASYIYNAFSGQGGGSLRYCGESKPWDKDIPVDENLRCVNYGNPDIHDISKEYDFYNKHKIAIVGWGFNKEYGEVRKDIECGDRGKPIKTGVTLMCKAKDVEHGIELLKRHKEVSKSYR